MTAPAAPVPIPGSVARRPHVLLAGLYSQTWPVRPIPDPPVRNQRPPTTPETAPSRAPGAVAMVVQVPVAGSHLRVMFVWTT